ncbi:MAG: MotA/TolQ/ExbB proton channel family protein [Verrucomicrobiae bacterium]|nr:MotA/TolQ/ExbB proton channel family protein [Verrucomicrobiae bacterium]
MKMKIFEVAVLGVALCLAPWARAQETLQGVANQAGAELEEALEQLSAAREEIGKEKIPLSKKLSGLEDEVLAARRQYDEAARELDNRSLETANLKNEIKAKSQESTYIANLLDEYIRNFESRVHIGELQRYKPVIEAARAASVSGDATTLSRLTEQMKVLEGALDRVKRVAGGEVFPGTAVAPNGEVKKGTFALVGPVAVFASEDGGATGLVEQKLGSTEPNVVDVEAGAFVKPIRDLVTSGQGDMPMDPTMGSAFKLAETKETIVEHIISGGPTMVPILGLAACALVVALIKWVQMASVREVGSAQMEKLFKEVNERGVQAGAAFAKRIGGHVGDMLHAGLSHVGEPKELIEEVMFEKVLAARLKVNNMLPFIALCASAAPLLGLLGTVTGMINTFKMITVFGTGDAKTLSGGISEALVTTEYGLIVAIPSLLMHAFMSRKAAGLIQNMEKVAISFLNRLPGAEDRKAA